MTTVTIYGPPGSIRTFLDDLDPEVTVTSTASARVSLEVPNPLLGDLIAHAKELRLRVMPR
jgi:hypothetical protein